jgi:hypothetical protein
MKAWVIAILSTACVADAFMLPQPSNLNVQISSQVRQPYTALQAEWELEGWELTKRNFKYLLVPNAKQEKVYPVAPADVSASEAVPTPDVLPDVPELPSVVPELPLDMPEPPVVLQMSPMEQTSLPYIKSVNTAAHTMQESYKNVLEALHHPGRIPGEAPNMIEYIKQGRFAGDGVMAAGEKLKHLPSLNFEALQNMKPMYFEGLRNSLDSSFGPSSSGGTTQVLQLNFDKMMSSIYSGPTMPVVFDKFTASFQNLGTLLQKDGLASAQEAIDALDLDELGAYYLGIIGLFLVVSRSGSTSSEVVDEPTKISPASMAATIETGVVMTKSETMQGQILELTQAITAMSEEMKALQTAKATRDYEIATLKMDATNLGYTRDGADIVESDLRFTLKRTEEQKVRQDMDVNSKCMAGYHQHSPTSSPLYRMNSQNKSSN